MPGLANELVSRNVDVIVTAGTPAAVATKQATPTVPIVMAIVSDPVGLGLVASLARPGANVTGLVDLDVELIGKQMELLKETLPGLLRVALLSRADHQKRHEALRAAGEAARALGVEVQSVSVLDPRARRRSFQDRPRRCRCSHLCRRFLQHRSFPARGLDGKEPAARDLLEERVCGCGRPDVLRNQLHRPIQAGRDLRCQKPPRRQAASFPYAHVDNLVEAVLAAVRTARAVGQAYNIVDGQTTGREYTGRFCHWLGLSPLPSGQEAVPWRGRLGGTKAERELGYVTRVSL